MKTLIPINIIKDGKLEILKAIECNYNTPTSDDIIDLLCKVFKADKLKKEYTFLVGLNQNYEVIGIMKSESGKKDSVAIDYSEVALYLSLSDATYFISAHNHPSGDALPSIEDVNIVKELRVLFENKLLDAIIIGDKKNKDGLKYGTFSFAAEGYFECKDIVEHYHNQKEEYLEVQINYLKRTIEFILEKVKDL